MALDHPRTLSPPLTPLTPTPSPNTQTTPEMLGGCLLPSGVCSYTSTPIHSLADTNTLVYVLACAHTCPPCLVHNSFTADSPPNSHTTPPSPQRAASTAAVATLRASWLPLCPGKDYLKDRRMDGWTDGQTQIGLSDLGDKLHQRVSGSVRARLLVSPHHAHR